MANILLTKEQNKLVTENINLVHFFAKKINFNENGFYDYEDIFQIGTFGLSKAAATYQKDLYKFSTYASKCIYNEIYSFLNNKRNFIVPNSLEETIYTSGEGEELLLKDVIADTVNISNQVEELMDIELLYNVLFNNFTYDKILLVLYIADERRQTDIAEEFNVTQCYISKLFLTLREKIKRNIQYRNIKSRKFNITIIPDKCTISFRIIDKIKSNMFINNMKEKFQPVMEIEVNYYNDILEISVPYLASLVDVSIFLIQGIRNNYINIVE